MQIPAVLDPGCAGGPTARRRRPAIAAPSRHARIGPVAGPGPVHALLAALLLSATACPADAQGVAQAGVQGIVQAGTLSADTTARDAIADRLAQQRALLPRNGGVLGLMGYGAIPAASASALQVNRTTTGPEEGDPTLTLSQFGFGFEVDETFPLWLEIYASYARYDPRAVLQGVGARDAVVRWNNFTGTIGVGWDFYLADSLYITPILNLVAGYAASDISLGSTLLAWRRNRTEETPLSDVRANVWGIGGSLMLTYFYYSAEQQFDVQARYTQLKLQTFGDSLPAARGNSTSSTISVWAQYRWPTGIELFRRPLRWLVTGAASYYFGDQRLATGFAWSTTIGGGLEFDVGRLQFGALGLDVSRVSFTLNYLYADRNITGASLGLGISF